jgi:hypothetical protein
VVESVGMVEPQIVDPKQVLEIYVCLRGNFCNQKSEQVRKSSRRLVSPNVEISSAKTAPSGSEDPKTDPAPRAPQDRPRTTREPPIPPEIGKNCG